MRRDRWPHSRLGTTVGHAAPVVHRWPNVSKVGCHRRAMLGTGYSGCAQSSAHPEPSTMPQLPHETHKQPLNRPHRLGLGICNIPSALGSTLACDPTIPARWPTVRPDRAARLGTFVANRPRTTPSQHKRPAIVLENYQRLPERVVKRPGRAGGHLPTGGRRRPPSPAHNALGGTALGRVSPPAGPGRRAAVRASRGKRSVKESIRADLGRG